MSSSPYAPLFATTDRAMDWGDQPGYARIIRIALGVGLDVKGVLCGLLDDSNAILVTEWRSLSTDLYEAPRGIGGDREDGCLLALTETVLFETECSPILW